ncbi:MAG: helix-turn-helix domain-containing protein [Bifidobacteriaceae bacterium]|jgi:excisionase family DNA binding protein|nr:helix-turn-helix domain-containing protein [Bifidobacteriaceae bacterium]
MENTKHHAPPAGRGLEPLLSIAELSEYLGVPLSTIYDWRTRREGPVAHRFGKHLKFAASDVASWLAAKREGATDEQG